MTTPSLPSINTGNLEKWKQYVSSLQSIIAITEENMLNDQRTSDEKCIYNLFETFVLPCSPEKVWNPMEVKAHHSKTSYGTSRDEICYLHDGVSIYYLGRVAYKLDDNDYFIRTKIVVDGKTLLDKDD